MYATSPHEMFARQQKVDKLIDLFVGWKSDPEAVAEMRPQSWKEAADCAGVKPPSLQTQGMVIARLRQLAKK